MKKSRILQWSIILSFLLILCAGCTKLLFERPIPNKGEAIQILPEFFNGKFLKKGEQLYYNIDRIDDKHCIVYSTNWIHKDSIDAYVEKITNDSTEAEFKDSALFIKDKDTTTRIELKLDRNLYYTEKEPVYEINLNKGYFIDDFDKKEEKKAILKYYENRYFLNIIDNDEKWLAIWLQENNDSLIIRNSFIADTLFTQKLSYYNGITKIEKVEDKTYFANPSDQELFELLDESSLFNEEIWIRVDDNYSMSWIFTIVGIIILLFYIIVIAWRKTNKGTN